MTYLYSIRMVFFVAFASHTAAFQSILPKRLSIIRGISTKPHKSISYSSSYRFSKIHAESGWIKASELTQNTNIQSKDPIPSPIEAILIRDRLVYIKHDDRLHLPHSNISGNKARKFYALNNISADEFPEAIVSYGGPQSNAMVALAAVVSSKNRELESMNNRKPSRESGDEIDSLWELDVIEEDIRLRAEENEDFVDEFMSNHSNGDREIDTPPSSEHDNSNEISHNEHSKQPKKRFIYYTKSIPRYLKNYPNGNFLRALALGMEIRTLSNDEYSRLFGGLHGGSVLAPADLEVPVPGRSLWMPQGGACSLAEPGSDILAKEIVDFWSSNGKGMALAVCLPGGTCTTALLLHRSINKLLAQKKDDNKQHLDIRVVVIPCVGDDEYALRQMVQLDKTVGGKGDPDDMPWILRPRTDIEYGSARRKSGGWFTFGQPAAAILDTYDEMNEQGLNLDLIYGAPAFSLLLQHWKVRGDPNCPIAGRQIMYVHSGGLEGVSSQLTRYKHNGLLDGREIMS